MLNICLFRKFFVPLRHARKGTNNSVVLSLASSFPSEPVLFYGGLFVFIHLIYYIADDPTLTGFVTFILAL